MSIMNLLAKLGILRYGTKAAVYRSGTERPAEFLMPDVMNAKRDLVTGWDLKTDAEREEEAKARQQAGNGPR